MIKRPTIEEFDKMIEDFENDDNGRLKLEIPKRLIYAINQLTVEDIIKLTKKYRRAAWIRFEFLKKAKLIRSRVFPETDFRRIRYKRGKSDAKAGYPPAERTDDYLDGYYKYQRNND